MNVKLTGFSLPLSPYQVFSWIQVLLWIIIFCVLVIPLKTKPDVIIIGLIFSISVIFLVWYCYKATSSNPTDPHIEESKNQKSRSISTSTSSDKYCSICLSIVHEGSKHCMTCNRCVLKFDHHCTWINNCIGSLNYELFFKLIITAEIFVTIQIYVDIDYLVYALKSNQDFSNDFKQVYNSDSSTVAIVFVFISLISAVVNFILNGILIAFHCWLVKNNTTTYKYLTRSKINSQVEKSYEIKDRLSEIYNEKTKYIHSISSLS